jgi:hypothetical protein
MSPVLTGDRFLTGLARLVQDGPRRGQGRSAEAKGAAEAGPGPAPTEDEAMSRIHRTVLAASVCAALALTATTALGVPDPTVTPVPENAPPGDPLHDYTFFTDESIGDFGYVEEEFFIEGTANAYDTPPLMTGSVVSTGHPYKTRIVVRRPAMAQRFNGTVILEWQNVSAGYDIDASWVGGNAEHFMREGYVWVGVSAQHVGIDQPGTGLRDWSPVRYGDLDVSDGGTFLDDELSYDIFSQAGQAVMSPVGVDPLGGLRPERILASGASQSAGRLAVYYNSIQPLANLFDGFVLLVGGGTVRTDLGVPVFKLQSESEAIFIALGFGSLQPDGPTVRTWQVTGSAHADRAFLDGVVSKANRDSIPTSPPGVCGNPEGSEVRLYHVVSAAHDHLVRWAQDGTLPPTAPLIETIGPFVARDEFGLALGGIRIADLAVPTALDTGSNDGPAFCILFGTHVPFDEATLDELYPNHGSYVEQVRHVVNGNLADGYITRHAAQLTTTDAAASDFGQ